MKLADALGDIGWPRRVFKAPMSPEDPRAQVKGKASTERAPQSAMHVTANARHESEGQRQCQLAHRQAALLQGQDPHRTVQCGVLLGGPESAAGVSSVDHANFIDNSANRSKHCVDGALLAQCRRAYAWALIKNGARCPKSSLRSMSEALDADMPVFWATAVLLNCSSPLGLTKQLTLTPPQLTKLHTLCSA